MQEVAVKRVAKNTVIMFIRMFVLMIISFLTSRWLLKQLGVEDYGIYSVVGSVTSTFVALKSLFSESIQRFLNFHKGKNNLKAQKEVFSISIIVHLILAILFVIILEVVGIWLINNKLVFPPEKYDTVIFVFQMTVISSVFSILCIPFDALIIANERMGFFALISILDGIFRLAVVIALPFIHYESLRAYSLLLIFIPVFSLVVSTLYSKRFPEFSFSVKFDSGLLKEIVSLSGWNFFGNISFSLLHEGINFTLNIFGGLVYNASRSIAYQVKNIAIQFSNNSLIAVRPMVMQSAADERGSSVLFNNIIEISRLSFFIMLIPIVPIEAFCTELLKIWLVEVPESAVLFTRLILVSVLIRSLHEPLNMLYMSMGKIKRMMIIEVVVMLLSLAVIYVLLSSGAPLWVSFALLAAMEAIIVLSLIINSKKELGFPVSSYLRKVVIPMLLLLLTNSVIAYLFALINTNSIILLLLLCCFVVLIVGVSIYFFLDKRELTLIQRIVQSKFQKQTE